MLLALGIAVTNFVEELFARTPCARRDRPRACRLGGLALLALIVREMFGLIRLGTIESLRHRALTTIENDDRDEGRAVVTDLLSLTRRMPQLARARTASKRISPTSSTAATGSGSPSAN